WQSCHGTSPSGRFLDLLHLRLWQVMSVSLSMPPMCLSVPWPSSEFSKRRVFLLAFSVLYLWDPTKWKLSLRTIASWQSRLRGARVLEARLLNWLNEVPNIKCWTSVEVLLLPCLAMQIWRKPRTLLSSLGCAIVAKVVFPPSPPSSIQASSRAFYRSQNPKRRH